MNEQLYASDAVSAYAKREKIFFELLKDPMRRCDTVIELGSGYGYNLAVLQKKYPSHQYLGGELSKNAIDVGNRLLLKRSIVIHPFNFYDPVYSVFRNTKSRRILVLTNHATEMLPDASLFLKRLAPFRNRIASVVQLEPVYEMAESSDLLGLLRRKYTQMNNYNMNLLAALCARPDIVIKRKRYDFFGINPLFPESLIEWQFK